METIKDYLIYDQKRYGVELADDCKVEYLISIDKINENPFYLNINKKDINHYELTISVNVKSVDIDGSKISEQYKYKLKFKMSSQSKPSLEKFSKHIKKECLNVIDALGVDLSKSYIWDLQQKTIDCDRSEIEPKNVYKFLKNIHKDYSKTEDFIKDYDHYVDRMYHCIKFMHLLIDGENGMYRMSWDYPIGEHFLAFLTDNAKFCDYYKSVKL